MRKEMKQNWRNARQNRREIRAEFWNVWNGFIRSLSEIFMPGYKNSRKARAFPFPLLHSQLEFWSKKQKSWNPAMHSLEFRTRTYIKRVRGRQKADGEWKDYLQMEWGFIFLKESYFYVRMFVSLLFFFVEDWKCKSVFFCWC